MSAISIALVGGFQLVRQGLRAIVSRQPELAVVVDVADAEEGQRLLQETPARVVVFDLTQPGRAGLAAAQRLLKSAGEASLICISAQLTDDVVAEGLALGVLGFASYAQTADDFVSAIQSVAAQQPYLPPGVAPSGLSRQRRGNDAGPGELKALSTREREVFRLLMAGSSNSDIAAKLQIGRRTVETHRAHLMRKLHLHSFQELLRFGIQHGLLTDDDAFARTA